MKRRQAEQHRQGAPRGERPLAFPCPRRARESFFGDPDAHGRDPFRILHAEEGSGGALAEGVIAELLTANGSCRAAVFAPANVIDRQRCDGPEHPGGVLDGSITCGFTFLESGRFSGEGLRRPLRRVLILCAAMAATPALTARRGGQRSGSSQFLDWPS